MLIKSSAPPPDNNMNKFVAALILSVLIFAGVTLASPRIAYAHTFSGDESAAFLALVETIKAHLQLVESDLSTNATNAIEHAEHAGEHLDANTIKELTERNNRIGTELPASLTELHETLEAGNYTTSGVSEQVSSINDLLDEAVTVRIENAQLTNSTVQGTMLADLVDEILESYNGAYGIEEEHEDDDHAMDMNDDGSTSNSTTPTEEELDELTTFELAEKYPTYVNEGEGNMTTMEEDGNHTTIVNTPAYEGAQSLSARALELFDTKLKAMADANATEAVTKLDAGLEHLKQAIDDKEPPEDVDTIIHSEVHPNIQAAFNLQVIPEFPYPILAVIMGITSVIAYTRLRRGTWI
jgi:hypothetical protein